MLTGTPLAVTLTTTSKNDPAIYVSVKSDSDGYVYSSTYTLTSEAARGLSRMVLEYLGYNPANDKNHAKLISGIDSVDTSKTIEFDLKETVGQDGKTYKNLTFPSLGGVTGKPKNMLSKEDAAVLIATHNLKEFFASIKGKKDDDIAF